MKTLKNIFYLLLFSIFITSCTPQALDDDGTNTEFAIGEDGEVDDGTDDDD